MANNDDVLQELISSSGHELQAAVTPVFQEAEWKATPNKYYTDLSTGKSREIDIVFEKVFPVYDTFKRRSTSFALRLFASCKFFSEPYLLRLEEKREDIIELQILDQGILREEDLIAYPERKHHLSVSAQKMVVKSWDKKSQRDALFDATTSSVHALVALEHMESAANYVVNYPIVLINSFDNLYIRDLTDPKGHKPVTSNLQLEFDYAFKDLKGQDRAKVFTVDIVAKDAISTFLESLENDAWLFRSRLHWKLEMEDRQTQDNDGDFDFL